MKENLSVILTIHNKENLIELVLNSIVKNISDQTNEIVLVFDGCNDSSEEKCDKIIKNNKNILFTKVYTDDVFELRANNFGVKSAKNNYCLLIQDDMEIKEKNFDLRMREPFEKFDDIFCVTSRDAHNFFFNGYGMNYKDFANCNNIPRNIFAVRDVINRGPILLKKEDMEKLNYFDEDFCPNAFDDFDLCLRAKILLNKVSGCYWIDVNSPPEWGTGRHKNVDLHSWAHSKNAKILFQRYNGRLEYKIEDRKI